MKTVRTINLIDVNTGDEHHFNSEPDACRFIGRSFGYITGCIVNSKLVVSKDGASVFFPEYGQSRPYNRDSAGFPKHNKHYKETLCFSCKNSAGRCDWSKAFIPVKGWEADPTYRDGELYSYLIKACPEYAKG